MNFFDLYAPLGDSWRLYDNSRAPTYRQVAECLRGESPEIHDEATWQAVLETLERAREAEA